MHARVAFMGQESQNVTCDGCGACCGMHGLPPGYSVPALFRHIPAELREELVAHLAEGRRTNETRATRGLACLWYDEEQRQCRHYAHRPLVCQRFQIATDACNAWRAAIGLPPFVIKRPTAEVVLMTHAEDPPAEAIVAATAQDIP